MSIVIAKLYLKYFSPRTNILGGDDTDPPPLQLGQLEHLGPALRLVPCPVPPLALLDGDLGHRNFPLYIYYLSTIDHTSTLAAHVELITLFLTDKAKHDSVDIILLILLQRMCIFSAAS